MATGTGKNIHYGSRRVDNIEGILVDEDDLFDVKSAVLPIAAKWKDVGIALRLRPSDLDGIETTHSTSPERCLTEMLMLWLRRNYNVEKFGEPTWQQLVEAVMAPAGGANPALANCITEKYKIQMKNSTSVRSKPLPCQEDSAECPYGGPVEPDGLVQDVMSWRMSWMAAFENWYHGKISRSDAVEKLMRFPEGCFLVRESSSYLGGYALSVRHHGRVIHRIVHSSRSGSGATSTYELEGSGKCFSKITDLVKYYRSNFISTDGEILKIPCPKNIGYGKDQPGVHPGPPATTKEQSPGMTPPLCAPAVSQRRRAGRPTARYQSNPTPSSSTSESHASPKYSRRQYSEPFPAHSQDSLLQQVLKTCSVPSTNHSALQNDGRHVQKSASLQSSGSMTPPHSRRRTAPKMHSGLLRYKSTLTPQPSLDIHVEGVPQQHQHSASFSGSDLQLDTEENQDQPITFAALNEAVRSPGQEHLNPSFQTPSVSLSPALPQTRAGSGTARKERSRSRYYCQPCILPDVQQDNSKFNTSTAAGTNV